MFEELKYRGALRKFLKQHKLMRRSFETIPDDPEEPNGEPRYKFTMARELNYQEWMIDNFRSHRFHVPVPSDEASWTVRNASDPFLTPEAAQKLRADIRAEQKAVWDYWANRVTLVLALIGSIFGVLAFFKR